jgi:NDP-sugar pyrophosphorylase family protein
MPNTKSRNSGRIPRIIESTQALILAGGLGTRLRPVFNGGPKSLAPIGGRLFLEYLLIWLRSAGIKELTLCVGYENEQIQNWLVDGARWGLHVTYSVEKTLLGTAGALKHAEKLISLPHCLVVNGDSFLDVNLAEMFGFHVRHRALATLALARVPNSARYGTVQLNRLGRVIAFREKKQNLVSQDNSPRGRRSSQLINGGVYLMEKQFISAIPSHKAISLEAETFPALVGKILYGFVTDGYFIDIGVPADYERAQSELPRRFRL